MKRLTFKRFLEDSDPLHTLSIEMWLRAHVKELGKTEARATARWLTDEDDEEALDIDAYEALYSHFSASMPYDVAKGRADVEPDTWIRDELTDMLIGDGYKL